MGTPWKVGCVIFDDSTLHEEGWAAFIDGDGNSSGAFRISGTHDLSSDVVWWLNLTYDEMYAFGMLGNAWFRNEGFLRLRMEAVFREWGMEKSAPSDKAVLGATVFHRVMEFVRIHYRFDRVPMDFLRKGLRDVWGKDDELEPQIQEALLDSLTEYVFCQVTGPAVANASREISFILPRTRHALSILESAIPQGNDWHVVPPKDMPKNHVVDESIRKWLSDYGSPVLIQVTVDEVDPDKNAILGLGSGVRKRKDRRKKTPSSRLFWESNRSWMTIDEAIVVSRFARVKVHNVIASTPDRMQRLERLNPSYPRTVGDPEILSWSYGLFLENVWLSRASVYPVERMASGWQVFYRSLDHVLSMEAAWRLHERGIVVTGYGVGVVRGKIPDGMGMQEVADAAFTAGVIPDNLTETIPSLKDDEKSHLGFLIRGSGDSDRYRFHKADLKCLSSHSVPSERSGTFGTKANGFGSMAMSGKAGGARG